MPEREREGASGSGGTEPACQRGTTSPAGWSQPALPQPGRPQPARSRPARKRRATGRLLATPTFLASACFVIVATLAYGTTQTHLLYSEPTCQAASCSVAGQHGKDGVTLKTTARPAVGTEHGTAHKDAPLHQPEGSASPPGAGSPARQHTSTSAGQSSPQPPVTMGGSAPAPRVAILFHPLTTWPGGFTAAVTIANHGKSALDGWQLWLRYRNAQIKRVWGARWFPDSARARTAGLVAAFPSQPKVRPGASERFTFRASGLPNAPVGCSFEGYHCSFKSVAGGNQQTGGHHSHKPGTNQKPGTKQHKS